MKIDNTSYNKILFIHVPKTGGSSINSIIANFQNNKWIKKYPYGHDPYFSIQKDNDIDESTFSFSVVRNPYTRAYSYYKHFEYHNNVNLSFDQFLEIICSESHFPKTPLIKFNQSFYLKDLNGNINLKKIYFFENLNILEKDLNIVLPHINRGSYLKKSYYIDYNLSTIQKVEKIYEEDFELLKYSKNFYET